MNFLSQAIGYAYGWFYMIRRAWLRHRLRKGRIKRVDANLVRKLALPVVDGGKRN